MHLAICSLFFLTALVASDSKSQGEKEASQWMQKYQAGEFDALLKSLHNQYLTQEKLKEIDDLLPKKLPADPLEKEAKSYIKHQEEELKKIADAYPGTEIAKKIHLLFSDQDLALERYFLELENRSQSELSPLESKLQEIVKEYFNKNLFISMEYIADKIDFKISLERYFALEKEEIEKMMAVSNQFDEPQVKKKVELYHATFLKRSAQRIDLGYFEELEEGKVLPVNNAEEKALEVLKSTREKMNKLFKTISK